MKSKLICHGCRNYYERDLLKFATKTKRLCPSCLEAYNAKQKAKERAKIEREAIEKYKAEQSAEKSRKAEEKRLKKAQEKAKKKAELEKLSAEEKEKLIKAKNNLYYLVAKTFNLKYPNGMMINQMNSFHDKRKLSYEGMALAWQMIVEVKGKERLNIDYGVALIPYYYEKAIERHQERLMKLQQAKAIAKPIVKKEVVTTKAEVNATRNNLLQRKMVNMEDLL